MTRRMFCSLALLPALLLGGLLAPAADAAPVPVRSAKRPIPAALPRPIKRLTTLPVPLDGVYGRTTFDAVRRFQWVHGLPSTGVADPRTIWQLGLVIPGTLGPGCRGTTVRDLQRALRHHDRFGAYVRVGVVPRVPRRPGELPPAPAPQLPVPAPTPDWPAFEPPAAPAQPLPPLPAVVAPPPAPVTPAAPGKGLLDTWANAWFAPAPGGGSGPILYGGGALWLGDLGAAGEYTLAPDMGGQAAGDVMDGLLRWRGLGPVWIGAGYRGFAGEQMGGLEIGLDQPLGVDWLRLRSQVHGSSNFGAGWLADSRAGLALKLGPVNVEAVYRTMVGDGIGGLKQMGYAYAPAASAGLRF